MASEVPTSPRWRPRRVDLHLFLISFAILFFELACIRWFGSTVVFLTFFTNIVLMACFLGMTVGCLAASRGRDYVLREDLEPQITRNKIRISVRVIRGY